MKIHYLFFIIIIVGCAQNATVELGFNDGAFLSGIYGDLIVRVLKIEIFQNGQFNDLWDNGNIISVKVNSDSFCSITRNYISIPSGSYKKMRITIDSLSYKIDNTTIVLLDSIYQFVADAFTELIIEDNEEYRIVIGIASTNWFDPVSQQIKTGHLPFEGASLKFYY